MIYCDCNLCGHIKHRSVYSNDHLSVVQCVKCGLVFQCPQTITKSDDYYKGRSVVKKDPGIFRQRRMQFIIKRLKEIHDHAEKALDVGCGWGHFLELLSKNYKHVAGVEPNRQQSDYLSSRKFEVYPRLYENYIFDEEMFDIVSFIQVLEHMPDPLEVLKASFKHLRRNGIIVIDVPSYNNPRFLLYRLTRCKFLVKNDFIKPHLYYFTPSTLKSICRIAGFKVVHSNIGQYSVKWGMEDSLIGKFLDQISKILGMGSITIYAMK